MPETVSENRYITIERHEICLIHTHKVLTWCRIELKHV